MKSVVFSFYDNLPLNHYSNSLQHNSKDQIKRNITENLYYYGGMDPSFKLNIVIVRIRLESRNISSNEQGDYCNFLLAIISKYRTAL